MIVVAKSTIYPHDVLLPPIFVFTTGINHICMGLWYVHTTDFYCVQLSSILLIEMFIVLASIDSCCLYIIQMCVCDHSLC